ncbi:MAG: RdgB/HAM1 family non-canonical purine NTP pyrophosphatase [Gammaproteobacteria bacterium]|nr:MAG: RdgB/HAM1 family non-canonical purine NTP pyrophosphatase [Gammaproteobacteria bacterium]
MTASEIVLASGNRGKQAELAPLFAEFGLALLNQGELGIEPAPEEGLTFVENALAKARHVAARAERPALADDSGLIVDALHGAPGVRSARFAGLDADDAANNRRLLADLAGRRNRRARFHCVLVLLRHAADPAPLIATGTWEGEILTEPRGSHGFGYDPLFLDPILHRSAAEMERAEKASVSHRGQAVRALLAQLGSWRGA